MRSTRPETATFAYGVGEEVVARLDGVDVYSFDYGELLPAAWRPGWTIASIMECLVRGGQLFYVLRFRIFGVAFVSVVPEDAIDGIA